MRRGWWERLLDFGNTPTGLPALDVSSGAVRRDPSPDVPPVTSKEQAAPARLRRFAGSHFSRHKVSDAILEQPLIPMAEGQEPGAPYHTPTSLSRLIPRMELFHKVMKDEVRLLNSCVICVLIC
jgi:hypothetical protein